MGVQMCARKEVRAHKLNGCISRDPLVGQSRTTLGGILNKEVGMDETVS